MAEKKERWFIKPSKKLPNDQIYINLVKMNRSPETATVIHDAKGKTHNVWEVDFPFIKYLSEQGASPEIFMQRGETVQRWRLLEEQSKRKGRVRLKGQKIPSKEGEDESQQKTATTG